MPLVTRREDFLKIVGLFREVHHRDATAGERLHHLGERGILAHEVYPDTLFALFIRQIHHILHALDLHERRFRIVHPIQQGDDHFAVGHELVANIVHASLHDHLPGLHNADVRTDFGNVRQNMRGEEDRFAHACQFDQQFADLDASTWVQPGGGFVEN